jgi:hypothetical protein
MQTFEADEVSDWVDDGETALCPLCHIDAVLTSKFDPIDPIFLKHMHARWFEHSVRLDLTSELATPKPPNMPQ